MIRLAADDVAVRGNATDEELAAVLAALAARTSNAASAPRGGGYERWRTTRIGALRRSPSS